MHYLFIPGPWLSHTVCCSACLHLPKVKFSPTCHTLSKVSACQVKPTSWCRLRATHVGPTGQLYSTRGTSTPPPPPPPDTSQGPPCSTHGTLILCDLTARQRRCTALHWHCTVCWALLMQGHAVWQPALLRIAPCRAACSAVALAV